MITVKTGEKLEPFDFDNFDIGGWDNGEKNG